MTLAEMKLMLKVAGWRLSSQRGWPDKRKRQWCVIDDAGDQRSRLYKSQWDAAEWGMAEMMGDEQKQIRILERYRAEQFAAFMGRHKYESSN